MPRAIFEEVGEKTAAPTPRTGEDRDAAKRASRRMIAFWLLIVAAMIIVQVVVGGLTRLTDSGLSITEWNLVTGVAPPLSEAAWLSEFDKYRQIPEYTQQNAGMSLGEFKIIYWWEWGHRFWGRMIGLAFLIPFAWFLWRKTVPTGWTGQIGAIGAMIVITGVVGWWMVVSGLVERVDVSHYRLAVHLGLAFAALSLTLWTALSLLRSESDLLQARRRRESGLWTFGRALAALLALQILYGAFVSGLDAGGVYGDWPTMGGGLFPAGEPFDPFGGAAAVQFLHRTFAYVLLIAAVVFWWRARSAPQKKTRLWASIVLGVLSVQVLLGIKTLLLYEAVPFEIYWIAAAHQATAILLVAVVVHALHQIAYPKEERIAA